MPPSKNRAAEPPDPAGALLSIAGLGLLLWAIIEAPAKGWTSAAVAGAGLASLAVLGAFVAWEARSSHPMLKLGFFADRRFSIAAAGECLGIFGLMGALFLQTQVLQFDLGYSPLAAGLRILPVAAVLCATAPLSPVVARVIGIRFTAAAGLAAIAGGLWWSSAVSTAAAAYPAFVPGMLLIGLGAGLLLPTATNSVIGSVPQGQSGVGSATNAVALQVGGALGVAVIGSVLSARYQSHLTRALAGQLRAGQRPARHRRLARRRAHRGGYRGRHDRRPARAPRACRIHERQRHRTGHRGGCRPRRCPPRAHPPAVAPPGPVITVAAHTDPPAPLTRKSRDLHACAASPQGHHDYGQSFGQICAEKSAGKRMAAMNPSGSARLTISRSTFARRNSVSMPGAR